MQNQVRDGDLCFTTCIATPITPDGTDMPEACQVYCDPTTFACYFEGGSPYPLCDYSDAPDDNGQVFC